MISFNPQCFFIDPPNCIYAVLARHNRRKRLINHLYSHLWKSWLYNIWVDQGRQPRIHRKRSTIQLYYIQRNSSGTYKCTAENSYWNGKKGTDSQFTVVNVQYRSLSNTQSCKYFVYFFHNFKEISVLWYLYLFECISLVCVLQWSAFNNNTCNNKVPPILIIHMFCLVFRNN